MTTSTGPSSNATRRPSAPTRGRLPGWLKRGLRAWARWSRGGRARGRRARLQFAATALAVEVLQPEDGGTPPDERRCGWFDSSQDLREGLCVSEHDSGDAVCAQLPVMAWVQLQLSGWRPQLAAAAQ
ncbi:MAG: hypothetical protein KIT17_23745 [Rubrivivax sp.]|nr:hypothetical protein [Rubrivivax sp.]